ncbi:MAG: hypothetical protein HQK76_18495 [Desulfobacterales bacterium]|nr:hypothetical protein [Desulfobacterales bacterium]
MKPFSKWTIEEVEDEFEIVLDRQSDMLKKWMTIYSNPSEKDEKALNVLCEKLKDYVWDWNDEELKINFIAPLISLTDFDQKKYKSFFSRELILNYNNEKLWGFVDFMVAYGKRSPKRPFFLINQYKKEHDSSDDPLGQLMVAMVTAQKLNNDNNPIYGAYIMGRYWHFTLLYGQFYFVHTGLNAANEDIRHIFSVLKNTKEIIESLV